MKRQEDKLESMFACQLVLRAPCGFYCRPFPFESAINAYQSSFLLRNRQTRGMPCMLARSNHAQSGRRWSFNTALIALVMSGLSRFSTFNEPFCSTLGSTMTYVFARYTVSELKLRETRLISSSSSPTPVTGACTLRRTSRSPAPPLGNSLSNLPPPFGFIANPLLDATLSEMN
jgi:hypothetical protein